MGLTLNPRELIKKGLKYAVQDTVNTVGVTGERGASDSEEFDRRPYIALRGGMFYNPVTGDAWLYRKLKDDVSVKYAKSPEQAIMEQSYFLDIATELGELLNNQRERTRSDDRRLMQLLIVRDDDQAEIEFEGVTEAHLDYQRRMQENYDPVKWHGYIGIQLEKSSPYHETVGSAAIAQRTLEIYSDSVKYESSRLQADHDIISAILVNAGLQTIELFGNAEADAHLRRITAWHGVPDPTYHVANSLENIPFGEYRHGKSLELPAWGEVQMQAIRPQPRKDIFEVDPMDDRIRWGRHIFQPNSSCVMVSIRTEIRAPKVVENMLDQRVMNDDTGMFGGEANQSNMVVQSPSELRSQAKKKRRMEETSALANNGAALFDNTEIVTATIVGENRSRLTDFLASCDLEAIPLINKQPEALLSVFPCSPVRIAPVRKNNKVRSILTNQIFPGIIAFSGLLRSVKPASDRGIILGLADDDYDYSPILTDVEGASRKNKSPVMLITGPPGSGKTMQLQQMCAQAFYLGYFVGFLNPKPDSSLAPFFGDLLGATCISMNNDFLNDNPGLLDPTLFLDRKKAAQILSNSIIRAMRLSENRGEDAAMKTSKIKSAINALYEDERVRCAGDVIFGNKAAHLPGLSVDGPENEILKNVQTFVRARMGSSPFWKAMIGEDGAVSQEIKTAIENRVPLLIEWDGELKLTDNSENLGDEQIDSILSVTNIFYYIVRIAGRGREGGMLCCDEAWVFRQSEDVMGLITGGAREWRQLNIMMVLATQRLVDFFTDDAGSDLASYIARMLIMSIAETDTRELNKYYELTKRPRNERETYYITNAGSKEQSDGTRTIPKAMYVDTIEEVTTGLICGPWPSLEFEKARTDRDAEVAKRREKHRAAIEDTTDLKESILAQMASEDESIMSRIQGNSYSEAGVVVSLDETEEKEKSLAASAMSFIRGGKR